MPERDLLPRVLVLTSTLPRWDGDATPAFVLDLCRELAREFEVHVLAPHAASSRRHENVDGVNIHRFRYLPWSWQTLAYDGGIPERLRRNPLAAWQIPFFLGAQLLAALGLAWSLRPALIHAHWVIPQGMTALLVGRLCPARPQVACTMHGSDVHGLNAGPLRWLKSMALRQMDLVTVVSTSLRDRVLALNVDPARLHVAPMGVDSGGIFQPAPRESRQQGSIVFVGRLVAGKGVDVLLRAWARISTGPVTPRLTVVGDGPERTALEAQVAALGLGDRVQFAGALSRYAVANQFRSAQAAVFPFTASEGFGLVIIEAQACGCPVIASDMAAVRDSIDPGITGVVVPPGDAEALARALQDLFSDPELAQRLSRAGRAAAEARFSWAVSGNRYRALLRELIRDA